MQQQADRFIPINISDKRVLVTAGAAGIGRVIAEGYRSAGAQVFVCDVDDTALETIKKDLPDIHAAKADVADPDAVAAMFDKASEALGGVDVLVNNAGIAGPTSRVEDIDPAALHQTLAVDVEGMFHCARHAVPMMKAAGEGVIVNLGSIAGRLSFAMRAPYAAAKWGVVGFTKSLALELGPHKIRVNAIMPGHVNTTRFRAVAAARAKTLGVSEEEMQARFLEPVALGTTVEPEDIANMALYLTSKFGAKITGQALSVCAGVEMMR